MAVNLSQFKNLKKVNGQYEGVTLSDITSNKPKPFIPNMQLPEKPFKAPSQPFVPNMAIKQQPFTAKALQPKGDNRASVNINKLTEQNTPQNQFMAMQKQAMQNKPKEKTLPFLESVAYGGEKVGAGLLGFGEGAFDFVASGTNKSISDLLMIGSNMFGGVGNDRENALSSAIYDVSLGFKKNAERFYEKNYAADYEKSIQERYKPSGIQQKVGDFSGNVAKILPTIAINTVAPGYGLPAMATSAAGNNAEQAYKQSGDLEKANAYGLLSGATEALTEKLFGGIPQLNKGVISTAISNTLKKFPAVSTLIDIGGEGVEEAISTQLDPVLRRMTFDPNASNATIQETLESALNGIFTSVLLQGGFKAGDVISNTANKLSTTMEQAIGQKKVNNIVKQNGVQDMRTQGINPVTAGTKLDVTKQIPKLDFSKLNTQQNNVILPRPLDLQSTAKVDLPLQPMMKTGYDLQKTVPNALPFINPTTLQAQKNTVINDSGVKVGKATTIKSLYVGKMPIQNKTSNISPVIDSDSVNVASTQIKQSIEKSKFSGKSFRNYLTDYYNSVFERGGGSRGIEVEGTKFDDKNYIVTFNKKAIGKVVSDPNLSAEKLAVFNVLDEVIENGTFVGSGEYNKHSSKIKDTIRFDYFETPVAINGKDYTATFDVEVFPGANNYRTHKVINNMDLVPTLHTDVGPVPTANNVTPSPSNPIIPQGNNSVNTYDMQDSGNNADKTLSAKAIEFEPPQQVSKVRSNTIAKSTMFSDAEKELMKTEDYLYDVMPEKQSLKQAKQRLQVDFDGEVADLPNKRNFDGTDIDTSMGIVENYLTEARKTGNYAKVLEWTKVIQQKGTESGQAIQAFAKYSRTPEGALIKAQQTVAAVEREIEKSDPQKITATAKETEELMQSRDNALDEISEEITSFSKKSMHDNGIPVADWAKETGRLLAENISKRTQPKTSQQAITQTMLNDLIKLADEHALPQKTSTAQRTAIDTMRDFFANREFYAKSWNYAKDSLRSKYTDNPEMLTSFDDWLDSTISFNGNPLSSDKTMLSAVAMAALDADVKAKDIVENHALGNKQAVTDKIFNRLTSMVGTSKQSDVEILKDAALRYTNEKALADTSAKRTDTIVRNALTDSGAKLNELVKKNQADKDTVLKEITVLLVSKYGIDGATAQNTAEIISDKYQEILTQKADATLESMFKEKHSKVQKTVRAKILELINLGAYDNESIKAIIKQKNKVPVLTSEDVQNILTYMENAQKYPVGSYERGMWEARGDKVIASKMPTSTAEKVITLLYDNMLGNIRTLLSRNAGGNLVFAVPEVIKQIPAAGLDKLVSIGTKQRTRTLPSINKLSEYGKGLARGGKEEILDYKNKVHTLPRGAEGDAINLNKRVFSGNILNEADRLIKSLLSLGDRPFYEAAYGQRMAELEKIKEMGKLPKEFYGKAFDEIAPLLARLDALDATFQGKTATAEGLTKVKEGINEIGKGAFGIDILGQFTVPFTRTPGSILERTIEYSPLGIIKNAITTSAELSKKHVANQIQGEKGFNQKRFVDETSRNLLGTGLMLAASALFNAGFITGGGDKDKDVLAAQKASGFQPYAVKIGDTYFSYEFLPIIGTALAAGADFTSSLNESGAKNPLQDAFGTAVNTSIKMTALQGVSRLFGGYDAASSIGNTVLGGSSQVVPSVVRQVASATDEYERETYDPNKIVQQGKYLLNSITFLRHTLPQKVDAAGKPILQNQGRNIVSKVAENMVSPSKMTTKQSNNVNDEAFRLYDRTGEKSAFLPVAEKSFTVDGRPYKLTAKEYDEYSKLRGSLQFDFADKMIRSSGYKGLSDDAKAKLLPDIYGLAGTIAKKKVVLDYDIPTSEAKKYQIYKDGIVNPHQYLLYKQTASTDGNSSISQAEAEKALNSTSLSKEQKAYIWQLDKMSKHEKDNPYR